MTGTRVAKNRRSGWQTLLGCAALTMKAGLALGVCLTAGGCQKSALEIVPVRGRITYAGGDWPNGGTLFFVPKPGTGSRPPSPGIAPFGADGKFSAKTASREGLLPGTYGIRVECWETQPQMSVPGSGKSWVSPDFQQGPTPDFVVDVPATATGAVNVSIDIPARK